MKDYLIKNATAFVGEELIKTDLLIQNGIITKIEKNIESNSELIDAKGLILLPAFFDMHCHLREPGQEYKEDIMSGTHAAVKGGYYAVCCMPNTSPIIDNSALVSYIVEKQKKAYCKVYPIGAISKGSKGEELAEIGLMQEAGAVAISDDGRPVVSSQLMRLAIEYAKGLDLMVISHCEDLSLVDGGMANEGYHSTISGLKGNTRASEEVMVAREIILASTLGAKVHIAHVSTKGSVELIREAKKKGIKVTCETCPHYFTATDELILSFDTNAKVNPPLREESDRLAIIEGLKDGTIDVIATDHAPHHLNEKNVEFALALNGISGIESSFSLSYELVKKGEISLKKLVELMSYKGSLILGLQSSEIKIGNEANIAIVELDKKSSIDVKNFKSKGKNNPFDGYVVNAQNKMTIVRGCLQYKA